jgi:hypothetical protein
MRKLYEYELYKMFDDYLDDTLELVKIGVYTYNPSYALQKIDKIAYEYEFGIFVDNKLQDGEIIEEDGEYYEVERE